MGCAFLLPQGLELEAHPRPVCLGRPILDDGCGASLVMGRKMVLADGVIFGLTKTAQVLIVKTNMRRVGNVQAPTTKAQRLQRRPAFPCFVPLCLRGEMECREAVGRMP